MKSLTTTCILILAILSLITLVSAYPANSNYYNNNRRGRKSITTTKKSRTTTSSKRYTTTTTKKAATTTTTKKATTTTTKKAVTTTTTVKTPAPTTPAGSGSGTTFTGDGTWYNAGLGSCGITNSDSEFIAALNAPQMKNGANPNNNPMCGRRIKVTNAANNKSVTVKIVDTCPPCASGSVDLSPVAFAAISDLGVGRIKISWQYVD